MTMFEKIREKLKGWKTVIVGAFVGVPLALLELMEQLKVIDPASVLPEPWGQRVALGLSITMIVLRIITTGPVGAKGDEAPPPDVKAGD